MKVRSAHDGDRDAIAAIHTASWQQSYRGILPDELLDDRLSGIMIERRRSQLIGPGDAVLVAETSGKVAGFCATWGGESGGYIDNLHVHSSSQSRGLGAALLGETARRLLSYGVQSAYLHVVASNERARSFYIRLGGQPGPIEQKNLYGTMVPNQRIDWPDLTVLNGVTNEPV